jgi:hypothetical protein
VRRFVLLDDVGRDTSAFALLDGFSALACPPTYRFVPLPLLWSEAADVTLGGLRDQGNLGERGPAGRSGQRPRADAAVKLGLYQAGPPDAGSAPRCAPAAGKQ